MQINIGSTNPTKVSALRDTLKEYEFLSKAKVIEMSASSEVSEQPKSLEETILGARNRAIRSFENCEYSVGLESGLIEAPGTNTGYIGLCICAIYDGKNMHFGTSSGFECPLSMMKMVFQDGLDLNTATHKMGLTSDSKIGNAGGLIGILSKGKIVRKDYTMQAIRMALIQLQNPELYQQTK